MPQIQRAADVGRQAWAPSAAGVSGLEKVTLAFLVVVLSPAILQSSSNAKLLALLCARHCADLDHLWKAMLSCVFDLTWYAQRVSNFTWYVFTEFSLSMLWLNM